MSKDQTELILPLSVPHSLKACDCAAGVLGWCLADTQAAGMTCVQQAPTPMATGNPVTVEVCVHDAHDHATSLTLEERDRPCRESLGGRCRRLTGETQPLRRLHEAPQVVEAHEHVVLGDVLSDASVSRDIT